MKCSEFFRTMEDWFFPTMDLQGRSVPSDPCFLDVIKKTKLANSETFILDVTAKKINLNESVLDTINDVRKRDDGYFNLAGLKKFFGDECGALSTTLKIKDNFFRNYKLVDIINCTKNVHLAENAADKINMVSMRRLAYLEVLKKNVADAEQTQRLNKKINIDSSILRNRQIIGSGIGFLFTASLIVFLTSKTINRIAMLVRS